MSKAAPWRPGSRSGKEVISGPSTSSCPLLPGTSMGHGAEARRKNTISLPPKVFNVDQDLCLLTTAQLRKRLLIGRFRSFFPGLKEISAWFGKICAQNGWKASVLRLIGKGFFLISAEEDGVRSKLLTGEPLFLKNMRCIFQPWRPQFDPLTEQALVPTWITLPFFPEELRNQLPMIANLFGKCIHVPSRVDEMHVRFCVQLDTSKGVSPVLELNCPEGTFSQEVEYDGIPLRCFHCRSMDHLIGDCPRGNAKGFIQKKGVLLTQAHGSLSTGVSLSTEMEKKSAEETARHSEAQGVEDRADSNPPTENFCKDLVQKDSENSTDPGRKNSVNPRPAQGERLEELANGSGKKMGQERAHDVIDAAVVANARQMNDQVIRDEELAANMGDNSWKVVNRYTRRKKPTKESVAAEARITRSRSQSSAGTPDLTGQITARKVDQTRFSKPDIRGKKIMEDNDESQEGSSEDDSLLHSVIPSRISVEPEER